MAPKQETSLQTSTFIHISNEIELCMIISLKCSFKMEFRLNLMNVASKLCEEDIVKDIIDYLPDEYLDEQTLTTIKDIAPEFNETFVGCQLFGNEKDCDKLFYPIITERGLWYTFNSLNLREIVTNQREV